jgi:hypothetical protein
MANETNSDRDQHFEEGRLACRDGKSCDGNPYEHRDSREAALDLPHSPLFFNLVAVPFPYDPNAPSPTEWLVFLQKLWPGDNPDAEPALDQPELQRARRMVRLCHLRPPRKALGRLCF